MNKNHTILLLTHNGDANFRQNFESYMHTSTPVVLVLIQGGPYRFDDVLNAIERKIPLLLLTVSNNKIWSLQNFNNFFNRKKQKFKKLLYF